jgi:hypothetical protein
MRLSSLGSIVVRTVNGWRERDGGRHANRDTRPGPGLGTVIATSAWLQPMKFCHHASLGGVAWPTSFSFASEFTRMLRVACAILC